MSTHKPSTITTARLQLRPFQEEDWPDVHAYASDPEVTRFMSFGPLSEDQSPAFARVMEKALLAREGVLRQER